MDLYHFDAAGRHVGTSTADESPLEPGVFLVPAHATPLEPLPAGQNEVAMFDGSAWRLVADYTGTEYWLPDGSHHVILELGYAPPEDALTDPPTLDILREQHRAGINRWRDEQEHGGIEHAGHRWDTDDASLQRINAVMLAGANPLGIWTSADNVDVPMSMDDMQRLFAAIVTRGSAIHARQREMKQAIEGMSLDELEAFQPGW
ncbi:DUF4376 domain-containing protein [Laribacter hongkongensis]|uniref:DUF4376 domain-containing protein n=1 Tax=Laribacter hongkongensis TaxID=168471 RepID=UPI001EFC73CB|nr:DUF4376 domain-containing protein [Laribacter hongkongensis]MCG9078929.1 DUF4376 domain-containing protein [Laribacter hongkongensis]